MTGIKEEKNLILDFYPWITELQPLPDSKVTFTLFRDGYESDNRSNTGNMYQNVYAYIYPIKVVVETRPSTCIGLFIDNVCVKINFVTT